ncbi:MAG: hypothetical protein ACK48K_08830, partial [Planctomycetota bacterium]
MARPSRGSKISPDEINIVHVWSQVVQQMPLLGSDPTTGQDFSHRKDWFLDIMAHQSMFMAIEILRFAIMDNHVHFLLRTRPDIVRDWSDEEVAWNYLNLCPQNKRRRKVNGKWQYEVVDPTQEDVDEIVGDRKKLKKLRKKLSSLSFWMQLLKQKVARRANAEVQKDDVCKGAFWKGRFEMTVIHSREYLLTCAVYIDLNPFKARMTDSIEGYKYTSMHMQYRDMFNRMLMEGDLVPTEQNPLGEFPESRMLNPIEFVEDNSPKGAQSQPAKPAESREAFKRRRARCSDDGFLEINAKEYLEVLKWSMEQLAAQWHENQEGKILGLEHAVVRSHGMSLEVWKDRVTNFRRL